MSHVGSCGEGWVKTYFIRAREVSSGVRRKGWEDVLILILILISFSVLSQSFQLHPNFTFYRKGSGPWWRRGRGRIWGDRECEEQSQWKIFHELSFGTESIRILIVKSQTFIFKNPCFCFVLLLFGFCHWQDCDFFECYWFPLLFTKALCTSKGCLQKSSVARLVPGAEGSLHSSYPPGARVQEFCILHQPHAPGRDGAGERRVGPLLCLPKFHKHLE